MSAKYLLAIDAGTSAVRCLAADERGRLIAVCRREWGYQTPPDAGFLGREFSPEDFWRLICEVIKEACHQGGITGQEIAGVSATSQREGIVFLDNKGRELYAGPNMDLRAVTEGMLLDNQYARQIYAITGHLPSLLFAPAKLRWFHRHRPEIFSRIASVLTINDWVIYRLCGERASEVCAAAEVGLIDVKSRTWSGTLIELLDLPRGIYPPLVPAGSRVGGVTRRASDETGIMAGTPVVQGAPDSHCGLLGMGITGEGEVGVVTGWSAPVQMVTGRPVFDAEGKIWTGCHAVEDRWILESSTGEAGNAFHWLMEMLFQQNGHAPETAYDEMDRLSLSLPPGADGVLAAIGPGIMNMSHPQMGYGGFFFPVPLSVAGVSRAHLARAALENICFAIRANLSQLEAISGLKAESISVGGNLTRSLCLKQILPAILDRQVRFARVMEVSGLGAVILAAAGSGIHPGLPEAINLMKSEVTVHEPDPLMAGEYSEHYQEWLSAIERLQEMKEAMK